MTRSVLPCASLGFSLPLELVVAQAGFEVLDVDSVQTYSGFKVDRLRYKHVARAARGAQEANFPDPLYRYGRDTPDSKDGLFYERMFRISLTLQFIWHIRNQAVLSIEGRSNAFFAPGPKRRRTLVDFTLDGIMSKFECRMWSLNSEGQAKRQEEIRAKVQHMIATALGDKVDDMLYISTLSTAPEYQGRGYGGAVLDAITSLGESQRKAAWLMSGNVENNSFYISHGFHTIATATIGDDPHWKKPRIVVQLMVREVRNLEKIINGCTAFDVSFEDDRRMR